MDEDDIMTPREALASLALKYQGDYIAMDRALKGHQEENLGDYFRAVRKLKVRYTTILDADFPAALSKIHCAPFVLFYEGDLDLLSNVDHCIAMVGSRKSHPYGEKMTFEFASSLAQRGYTIVSGLAAGIDTKALEGALPHGKAVAFLGNGTRHYYPPDNEELQRRIATCGLLISEYPPFVAPKPRHFPARNRLIAGSSALTIIGEAQEKSGSLITAGFALSYQRDVACFPQQADVAPGSNHLISDGAFLIQDIEDVETILGSRLIKGE